MAISFPPFTAPRQRQRPHPCCSNGPVMHVPRMRKQMNANPASQHIWKTTHQPRINTRQRNHRQSLNPLHAQPPFDPAIERYGINDGFEE